MSKHTQRTLKYFRDKGYTIDVIERWIHIPGIPGNGKRRDFLGFGDLLAFNKSKVALVQSCGSSHAAHVRTILDIPAVCDWLEGDNREVFLVSWRKVLKKRGGKQKVFKPRVAEFFLVNGECEVEEISKGP